MIVSEWVDRNSPVVWLEQQDAPIQGETKKFTQSTYNKFIVNKPKKVIKNKKTEWYDANYERIENDKELLESDIIKIKPRFDVFVKGVKQLKPITKIKLKNPSFPEQVELKITGNQYWCNGLPDDLYLMLIDILAKDIKYNTLIHAKNEFNLATLLCFSLINSSCFCLEST
jgi:hypothetical protein